MIIEIVRKIFIISLLISAAVLVPTFANAQQSTPLTDAQIEQIKLNCANTQTSLSRIHASDALLRVNLGRQYESISTKLMTPLNSRISLNRLDGTKLVGTTATYEDALDKFRSDYQVYEQSISRALNIDCTKQPLSFYDAVVVARENRSVVANSTATLNKLVVDYRYELDDFTKLNLEQK